MVQATAMNSALQEGQSILAPGIPSHLRPKVHRLVDCHLGFSEGWPKSNLKELDGLNYASKSIKCPDTVGGSGVALRTASDIRIGWLWCQAPMFREGMTHWWVIRARCSAFIPKSPSKLP
jgi:hypothetical protein